MLFDPATIQQRAALSYMARRASRPAWEAMFLLEFLIAAACVVAAAWTRPWRLLASQSRYRLLPALLLFALALPALWWWPHSTLVPLSRLVGVQLALLMLGWPLAVLLFAFAGVVSLLLGATLGVALPAMVWHALVPATLALAAGHGVRLLTRANPIGYVLGRGLLVPFAATVTAAALGLWFGATLQSLGPQALAVATLIALLDAMLTAQVVVLVVMARPAWLATWSDRLYLRPSGREGGGPMPRPARQ